jgi:Flp pilus assembly protein TadD
MRFFCGLLLTAAAAAASPDILNRADQLYRRTEYQSSLRILSEDASPDAANYFLRGKNFLMSGDPAKAIECFEKARGMSPENSEYELWLGRAWGRRAEAGSWLTAMSSASKARQCFEKAVALDPHNPEAKNDLFDYYLHAPGLLGGGIDKAEALAQSIAHERPAEFEFEEAQIANHRKDYGAAETHLRRALDLAPREVGRVLDLARFLAGRSRFEESDQLFERAENMAPAQPKVAFAIASADIESHRNLGRARNLLRKYLKAGLTPDDPPRQEAEKLLRRSEGS